MARIVVGAFLIQFPLGGYLSWTLQWLVGLQRLGHDIYLAERSGWPNSCYDASKSVMTDDCSYGTGVVNDLLARFALQDRWCYVDVQGYYHGLSRDRVEAVFQSADLFIDLGTPGAWNEEAGGAALKVLIDGRPGRSQMRMELRAAADAVEPRYDYYYTVGRNIGTASSTAPTAGKQWRPIFYPVILDLAPASPVSPDAPFTTVMAWAHEPFVFHGQTYGAKDIEFAKFIGLPKLTRVPLELAVSGPDVPRQELTELGWLVRGSLEVSLTYDSFWEYVRNSRGEFGVCKNVYVVTNSGWFGDREAVYLACGRPVVMQETGFSQHLPCGEGLFAVRTVEEAAAAIDEIDRDYARHSARAREIAGEYLDAPKVLGRLLADLGIQSPVP